MSKSTAIGPWPLGVDNVHHEDDEVFQQGRRKPTQRLLVADNVDLRDDGWPVIRQGTAEKLPLASARALFSGHGHLLAQADDTLYRIDTTQQPWVAAPLYVGLDPDDPPHFVEHADCIYWLNHSVCRRVLPDGTDANWGLPAPPAPTLTPTAGNLCPGTYTVALSYVDVHGVEHGLGPVTTSTVGNSACHGPGPATGFIIDHTVGVPEVDRVRIYISEANGPEVYFVADAEPGDFPIQVTNGGGTPWSDVPPLGLFCRGPVPGGGVFEYAGALMTFTGNMLYGSYGPAVHLFQTGLVADARPTAIRGGAGLDGGFWTITNHGAYWTTGDTPEKWFTLQKDIRTYAAGSIIVSGRFIPDVGTLERVAVFVTDMGIVAGLPDGTIKPITPYRYHFDVLGKRAQFMTHAANGTRYLQFTLN